MRNYNNNITHILFVALATFICAPAFAQPGGGGPPGDPGAPGTYSVNWIDLTSKITESNGVLTRNTDTGWGHGANGSNVLPPNTDGWIEFTVGTSGRYVIGFGINDGLFTNNDFRNGIYINSANISTYEATTNVGFGNWVTGEVYRISREGSEVKYYRNGVVIRTVTVNPALSLRIKAVVYNNSTPVITASFDARIELKTITTGTGYVNGTGSISLTAVGGTAPYTYSWSSGEQTASLSNKNRGVYTVTVMDANSRVTTRSYNIGYKTQWLEKTSLITDNNGILSKSGAGWNHGATSTNLIPSNTDGYVEFIAKQGGIYLVGFGEVAGTYAHTDLKNAFYLRADGILTIYEGSATFGGGNWFNNDIFRVAREGASIKYYQNGQLLRTSTANVQEELKTKVVLYSGSAPAIISSSDVKLRIQAQNKGTNFQNGTANISVNMIGGSAPYTYSWSSGENTNAISNKPRGTYSLTVTDAEGRTESKTYNLGYFNFWRDFSNATESNGILTKTTGSAWNAGANSSALLVENTDGWLEFVVGKGKTYILGFGNKDNNFNYTSFIAGINITSSGSISAREASSNPALGSCQEGDVIRIAREGGSIKYYRNGMLLRTITVNANTKLAVKASLSGVGDSAPFVNTSFWIPSTEGTIPDIAEFRALKELYDSLGGVNWINKTNWPTTWPASATPAEIATWHGITVTNNDITTINLAANNLIGKLPASVGNIGALQYLHLNSNTLQSTIPSSIGLLTNLRNLHLYGNQLTGAIPASFGNLSSLLQLYLHGNQLSGNIPSGLGNLTSVTSLQLHNNQLSGNIPSELNNLVNLTYLSLNNNSFTGDIPNLGSLTKLGYFYVYDIPTLSGPFPDWLGQLTNLTHLYIYNTKRTGPIPVTLSNNKKLINLYAQNNQLTGGFPYWITDNNPNLQIISFDNNQLSGELPSSLAELQYLKILSLLNNKFTGSIPASFGNFAALETLQLGNNLLTGQIPATIGSLNTLKLLYLFGNQLSGPIPGTINNLTNVTELRFNNNLLSGTFPNVSNLTKLVTLDMNDNKFTRIQESILTLPALRTVNFYNNSLDTIPNFANAVNKANLTVRIFTNYLSFYELEKTLAPGPHGLASFQYASQRKFDQVMSIPVPQGETLVIKAANPGNNSTITWERQTSPSVWTNVNALNEDTSQKTFKVSNVTPAMSGYVYRWKMTNSVVTGMTLSCDNITIYVTDPVATGITNNALYNGLITSARWRTDAPPTNTTGEAATNLTGMYYYQYDDKYQIKDANWADYTGGTYTLQNNKYRVTNLAYDPNGNIQTLNRYDKEGYRTNEFAYTYEANNNKLQSVSGYTNVYTYNAIGQMIGEEKVDANASQYVEYDVTGKVRKVFSDAAHTKLKTEFKYDDRGFRLAKITYPPTGSTEAPRTTWYIRDASGNVLSIYEEDNATATINRTEIPIYGSGKLGTYYPLQDGSMNYELTDHLGNVRALVRDNVNIYRATMEDNGQEALSNPRVEEMQYFQNLFETQVTDWRMNHTAPTPGIVDTPNKAAYLYWLDGMSGMEASDKAVGPAITLKVKAGDSLKLETWARFERKTQYARHVDLALLSSVLGYSFAYTGAFEGSTISQTAQALNNGLLSAGFLNDGDETDVPFAYLNYLIFDKNRTYVDGGWKRVTDAGGFIAGSEGTNIKFDTVKFANPIIIPSSAEDGYIYIWVSNESQGTKVWFDDLTITHTQTIVTQATDYGVWGDVLREMKSAEITYRHGYQGQFAEKDEETGWNHFELREYDPVIGRWTTVDPMRVGFSPYIGMGNNPVNAIDPDGGAPLTDFLDANGNLIKHIDDGSNAVFQMTGTNQDQIFKFKGWSDQGGKNIINFTSVIQEQQIWNMSNTFLVKGWDGSANTWCNRATMNVVEAVESGMVAMGNNTNISLPWENANNIGGFLAKTKDIWEPLTQDVALEKAKAGNLVITSWINPKGGSGHLTTLSVGDNVSQGVSAHIGGTNGFRKLSNGAYYDWMMPSVTYYMLKK